MMDVQNKITSPVAGSRESVWTWDDAVTRWNQEKVDKASLISDQCIFRWLNSSLSGLRLSDIGRNVVDEIKIRKMKTGVANATVNRMLALVRSVLRRAVHDWEWIDSCPKVRLLKEPVRRVRFLTAEQAHVLLAELPEHLAAMAAFSLATGLRKSNVTGLQWSQVDIKRRIAWIHPDQSKSRNAIAVPLNSDALRVLAAAVGKNPTYVFTFHGEPVGKVSTAAWKKSLKRANIENFRWHDLRHTWASWHVQNGTPLNVLQELGGWESAEMVRRYAHFSAGHLADFVSRLPSLMHTG